MYYVYILYSLVLDKYYVGHTWDIPARVKEHNNGKDKFTRAGIPWELKYFEVFKTRGEAMKREYEIKRKKRRSYIEWLITGRR